MKEVSYEIREFMERELGLYMNPNQVEVSMSPEGDIGVSARWNDESIDDDFALEFTYDVDNIDMFVDTFGINDVNELQTLKADALLEQFHLGKAEIYCAIDCEGLYYELFFHKSKDRIWVRDEDGTIHMVRKQLETPSQFIDYLREHGRANMIIF
jgi:hypothetical protein